MYILWLIILGAVLYYIFSANKTKAAEPSGKNALDMLKERYINGEIDEAEYHRKKSVIEK